MKLVIRFFSFRYVISGERSQPHLVCPVVPTNDTSYHRTITKEYEGFTVTSTVMRGHIIVNEIYNCWGRRIVEFSCSCLMFISEASVVRKQYCHVTRAPFPVSFIIHEVFRTIRKQFHLGQNLYGIRETTGSSRRPRNTNLKSSTDCIRCPARVTGGP